MMEMADSAYWRERAEVTRHEAIREPMTDIRLSLLGIADLYEAIAEHLEALDC